jgi:hypothetical protein
MLTTGVATAIALVVLAISCALGGVVGFVMCLTGRLPWNAKVATGDVGLAAVVSIAAAYAYSAMALARGHLSSGVTWILLTATISVVVRQVIRRALR